MALPLEVETCLGNLRRYCSQTSSENEALTAEVEALRGELGLEAKLSRKTVAADSGISRFDAGRFDVKGKASSLAGLGATRWNEERPAKEKLSEARDPAPPPESSDCVIMPFDVGEDFPGAVRSPLASPHQAALAIRGGTVHFPSEDSQKTATSDRPRPRITGNSTSTLHKEKIPFWQKELRKGNSAEFMDDVEETDSSFTAYSLAAMRIGMISNSGFNTTITADSGVTGTSSNQTIGRSGSLSGAHRASVFNSSDWNPEDGFAQRVAKSLPFKVVCVAAIVLNTVWIAIAADLDTKDKFNKMEGGQHDPELEEKLAVPEWVFTVWFTIELVVRIANEKVGFITGTEQGWNFCDSFLVFNSYIQHALPEHTNVSFIRILRVFRLTRVVKVIKTVPCLRSLRTMVFSIVNSFVNLLWALLVLALVIFMFSIIFQNGVAAYVHNAETSEEIYNAGVMKAYFGNLYETMVTLLASATGGNDWIMYADLLRLCSPKEVYMMIFMFYIVFTVVGLLNVVTGIFVDSAVCTRTEDEVIETWKTEQKNTSETLRNIFKDGDADDSGTMTITEFRAHLLNPWVRAYFSGLEIDPSDAVSIFTLIAREGCDEVEISEFVSGVMKLKGHAKSVDVLTLMYDSAMQTANQNKFMNYVEDQLRVLRGAGASPPPKQIASSGTQSIASLGKACRKSLTQNFNSDTSPRRRASKTGRPIDPTLIDCDDHH